MRVSLRKRTLSNGRKSLYLEIYHNGKVSYEFLKLYIEKPTSTEKRQQNRNTLKLANTLKAKRQVELQDGTYGVRTQSNVENDFIKYFENLTNKRKENGINYGHWWSTLKHIKLFTNRKLTFTDVDIDWLKNFKIYLVNTLNQNTAFTYFNKVKAALHQASREKLIYHNPALDVKSPKHIDSKREFLTIEEVRKLAQTECKSEVLKRAFLFSCLTGLRWSDVNKLMWKQITYEKDKGYSLFVKQQKTKQNIIIPLTQQSIDLIGWKDEYKNSDKRVFIGLNYSSEMNIKICQWVLKAGITKHITFHCARHTHATLLLANGTDIYTVSKLLGHREVRTTQIYAKVMDESKRKAVDKLPEI